VVLLSLWILSAASCYRLSGRCLLNLFPKPKCLVSGIQHIQNRTRRMQIIPFLPHVSRYGVLPHSGIETNVQSQFNSCPDGFGGFEGLARPDPVFVPARNTASHTRSHKTSSTYAICRQKYRNIFSGAENLLVDHSYNKAARVAA